MSNKPKQKKTKTSLESGVISDVSDKQLISRKHNKTTAEKKSIKEPSRFSADYANQIKNYLATDGWIMPEYCEKEVKTEAIKKQRQNKKVSSVVAVKKEDRPHYYGHRNRLRERFTNTNGYGCTQYELLELILFRTIARADTKPLAKKLFEHFGSLTQIFSASLNELCEIPGCGLAIAQDLKIIFRIFQEITAEKVYKATDIFTSWEELLEHCRMKLAHEKREVFYLLFLNKNHGLIKAEIQQIGTIDQATVYPREIVKRALELGACGLVLVHNHPSGNLRPSKADIEMTKRIQQAAGNFNIILHDHLIIGEAGEYSSLRECGIL